MIYFQSTVAALRDQIADLRARLDRAEAEKSALLDRLLERNNIAPVSESAERRPPQSAVQVISPFGVLPVEANDAVKASWIDEEMKYQMMINDWPEDRARAAAEHNYLAVHQGIS